MEKLGYITVWIGLSLAVGYIAVTRGRSPAAFFLVALLLSPLIGIIAVLVVAPGKEAIEEQQLRDGKLKKCYYCAEAIMSDAAVCKHCGKDVVTAYSPTQDQWDVFVAALQKKKSQN